MDLKLAYSHFENFIYFFTNKNSNENYPICLTFGLLTPVKIGHNVKAKHLYNKVLVCEFVPYIFWMLSAFWVIINQAGISFNENRLDLNTEFNYMFCFHNITNNQGWQSESAIWNLKFAGFLINNQESESAISVRILWIFVKNPTPRICIFIVDSLFDLLNCK